MGSVYKEGIASLPRRFQEGGFVTREAPVYQDRSKQIALLQQELDTFEDQMPEGYYDRNDQLRQQRDKRIESLNQRIAEEQRIQSTPTGETRFELVDQNTGDVVGSYKQPTAALREAYERAPSAQAAADLRSGLEDVYGTSQVSPETMQVRRELTPNIASFTDFLEQRGVDTSQLPAGAINSMLSATRPLTGGTGLDPRNFEAILGAEDPLAALRSANRAVLGTGYNPNEPTDFSVSVDRREVFDPVTGELTDIQPTVYRGDDRLRMLGIRPQEIVSNAYSLGLDISDPDVLRQAGVSDSVIQSMSEAGQLIDYGGPMGSEYLYDPETQRQLVANVNFNPAGFPQAPVAPAAPSVMSSETLMSQQPQAPMATATQPVAPVSAVSTVAEAFPLPGQETSSSASPLPGQETSSSASSIADSLEAYYANLYGSNPYFQYYGTPYMYESVFDGGVYNPTGGQS